MAFHQTASGAAAPATTSLSIAVQAGLAVLLGILILGTVGFSHVEAFHNAAHDTRHANAFPCH